MQAAGGLPLKKSAQEYVGNAATQVPITATVRPLPLAWLLARQLSLLRLMQVAMSPKTRVMLAPAVQLCRLAHCAVARLVHAWSGVMSPPSPPPSPLLPPSP